MSSSKIEPQPAEAGTLVPAGLPFAYVSTWATAGIASLAYLSFAVSYPGNDAQKLETSSTMAQADEVVLPEVPKVLEERRKLPAQVVRRPEPVAEVEKDVEPIDAVDPFEVADRQRAAGAASDNRYANSGQIETKYVTTSQILANNSVETQRGASSPQPGAAPGASRIVTGSIVVPPPPDRAPPRPAVSHAALKRAMREPSPVRKTAARPKRPATPSAPITFGPAVVKPAAATPPQPAGLAVLLATGSSVDSLRLTWDLLQERHSGALSNLSPRYIVENNPAAPDRKFALLAGPVVSAADVARICGALQSEGLTCRTRPYGGNRM
ncbi:MAG: hypothetical protein RIC14_13265 [Filomicrobium sp.]